MVLRDPERRTGAAQFSLRVAVLGSVALLGFLIIFFRLWYLEVLSGDRYRDVAANNQLREVTVQAPRGEILDRDGKPLVANRTVLALQVRTNELPEDEGEKRDELRRLGPVAGMGLHQIERKIRVQTRELPPGTPVTLQREVPFQTVYYLREKQAAFPGVSVERVYLREYPKGTLAAHLFGYVREVTAEQLDSARHRSLSPGDSVGQAGVEFTYDGALRGENGVTRVQVDAAGTPSEGQLESSQPRTGNSLRLALDANLQRAGENALATYELPGAFVAMDIESGEILGMGSYPTFDPGIFTRTVIPPNLFENLTSKKTGAPLADRSIQGLYPTGSIFKVITATAAMQAGLVDPTEPVNDPGQIKVDTITFKNSGGGLGFGPIDMRRALQVSSDVYFYKLGLEADNEGGDLIQDWASQFGLGSLSGIDLPAEQAGLVPTPEWRDSAYEAAAEPDSPGGTERIFGEIDRPWTAGDNINLSVGQGDLQANPLQMAVVFAAIANGGDVVRPHVGLRVEDPSGRVVQEILPPPRRHIEIAEEHRAAIMEGLRASAMEPTGTSYKVFGGWPIDIAGKTGTAERGIDVEDQAWFVALAPYENPEIVVALTLEKGGFGADSAAPAVAQILMEYLGVKFEDITPVEVPPTPTADSAPAAPTGGTG